MNKRGVFSYGEARFLELWVEWSIRISEACAITTQSSHALCQADGQRQARACKCSFG